MTRRRWIADEVNGPRAAILGAHAQHLVRVLRVRIGDEFDVSAGDVLYRGRVSLIEPERVEFSLGEILSSSSVPDVTLLLAIFKFDRMEWAIEKATELGVARLIPLAARRSDRNLVKAAGKRVERWRRIVLQATEQSRRTVPPSVEDPLAFSEIRIEAPTRILLAESEDKILLKDAIAPTSPLSTLALAVGPEGGWTNEEQSQFQDSGWIAASLGNTILRAETAAIAALAVVFSELQ